jgi:hypothetical protein
VRAGAPEIPAVEFAALRPRPLVHELREERPALSVLHDQLVKDRDLVVDEAEGGGKEVS